MGNGNPLASHRKNQIIQSKVVRKYQHKTHGTQVPWPDIIMHACAGQEFTIQEYKQEDSKTNGCASASSLDRVPKCIVVVFKDIPF